MTQTEYLETRAARLLAEDSGFEDIAYVHGNCANLEIDHEGTYCGAVRISDASDLDGVERDVPTYFVGCYTADDVLLEGACADVDSDEAMLETVKRAIATLERRAIAILEIQGAIAAICSGETSIGDALRAISNCPYGDESPGMVFDLERAITSYVVEWSMNMADAELLEIRSSECELS